MPFEEIIQKANEIGHDVLHTREAVQAGGFRNYSRYILNDNRLEYQANLFASQVDLPDDEIWEYIGYQYDINQIVRAMYSDPNLVALKIETLNRQGCKLRLMEYRNNFLKY